MKRHKSGKFRLIRLDIRVVAAALLLGCVVGMLLWRTTALQATATVEEGVQVPIIMYHSLLRDEKYQGTYVISPDTFESDIQFLLENGYETILVQDLIDYVHGGTLPEKPVMLTFDDGYFNNYCYGFELAKKYGIKFVISPIGSVTDLYTETHDESPYYAHASWAQLKEMADSGLVEVQSHSYNLHKNENGRMGVRKKQGESPAAYQELINADLQLSIDKIRENIGTPPTSFAYPFGAVSPETPELVRSLGFQCILTSEEKISTVLRDPESLFGLGRFVRPNGISTKSFFTETVKLPLAQTEIAAQPALRGGADA